MKRITSFLLGTALLIAAACATGSGPMSGSAGTSRISLENLSANAENKFRESLEVHGGDRKAATERTAAYLKTLPGVKEVTVRGSDSLFVVMTDGNELLLMLGRDRL